MSNCIIINKKDVFNTCKVSKYIKQFKKKYNNTIFSPKLIESFYTLEKKYIQYKINPNITLELLYKCQSYIKLVGHENRMRFLFLFYLLYNDMEQYAYYMKPIKSYLEDIHSGSEYPSFKYISPQLKEKQKKKEHKIVYKTLLLELLSQKMIVSISKIVIDYI